MQEVDLEALRESVEGLHNAKAKWIKAVPVKETFQGKTIGEDTVQVLDLIGHPTATRCYAWSHVTKGQKRRFVAVLHQGPVDSPQKAVSASIVQEYRKS